VNRYLSLYRRVFNTPPAEPPVLPPAVPPAPSGKTFTEEQVAKMMEEHRKGLQTKNAELIAQLEEAKKASNLTAEERDNLTARIDALGKEHLTKEQQQASEYEKLKKKYDTDVKVKTEEATTYKSMYENTLIEHALVAAASKHKAHSTEQMLRMFKTDAKVVPILDDTGKPTGGTKVVMPVKVTDPKTQQPITLELSVDEAIGKIREDDNFANMFIDTSMSGFDENGNPKRKGSAGDKGPPLHDPVAYREWRKNNK
jgi:hypothetical protein